MNTRFSAEDEAFRGEIAGWLENELSGEFAEVRGRGGPGDEHAMLDERDRLLEQLVVAKAAARHLPGRNQPGSGAA